MLDRELARTHGYRVGDTLQFGETTMEVVGIVRPPLRPGKAHVYMSIEDARKVLAPRLTVPIDGMINALLVESKSAFSHAAAHDELRRVVGSDVRIATYGCGVLGREAMNTHLRLAGQIAVLLSIGMSLLVLRGQAASAHERRMEIAILKCIGWSDRAVLKPLAAETGLLAAMGSLAGAVGAGAILAVLSQYAAGTGAPLQVSYVLLGMAWAMGLGLVATWVVARAATRAQPASLLRKP
jgi:cell division protein FtsX